MNRTITISLLVGVLIFVMWFGVLFFLIPKLTEVKVMPDPSASPPVNVSGRHGCPSNGSLERIIINVRPDGVATGKDFQLLETDETIAEYISRSRDEIVAEGLTPKLHLRGDENSLMEHSRRVIRIAAEQQVTQVVFATYMTHRTDASGDKGEKPIDLNQYATPPKSGLADSIAGFIAPRPREQDLNMALPTPIKPEVIGETVFISVNAQGHILYGNDKQLLDQDTTVRELPLLMTELEKAKQRAGDKKVLVTMHVEPDTVQQRVIDVLNALAACGITSVSFTDLIE